MNICVFDTETGGVEPKMWTDEHGNIQHPHPLIQIAAVVVNAETGDYVDEFERKIIFDVELATEEALNVNSYDEIDWICEAVPERTALDEFAKFMRKYDEVELISKKGNPYNVAQLAAYNAPFDMDFVVPRYRHHDIFMPGTLRALDVMQLVLFYFHCNPMEHTPENMRLATVYEFFGLGDHHKNAHDALSDARMAADVYYSLSRSLGWDR